MKQLASIVTAMLLVGCVAIGAYKFDDLYGKAEPQSRNVEAASDAGEFYLSQVKPILDNRCVVCHACYDAPCQLKLSSPAGIDRGVSSDVVYNGTRLVAATPHRLFIDAQSTAQWRELGFSPILNEREQRKDANLAASVLYNSLQLKQANPEPSQSILNEQYDFSLDRTDNCAAIESYHNLAAQNPQLGMPYGFPALSTAELKTLTSWLENGAKMAENLVLDDFNQAQLQQWETFLNHDDLKHQLVARYIYEHWFLAHLHFNSHTGPFFNLVRSSTPPGQPITPIATRRPFDEPGVERVYYRFLPVRDTITSKNHIPLKLDQYKLARIEKLFIETSYQVTSLPTYEPSSAANPFKTFAQIPSQLRYRFMLDDAQVIIMGFIKGPVCRGQIALNVINDHFWVAFVEPSRIAAANFDEFLQGTEGYLDLPAEQQSTALAPGSWLKYSQQQAKFLTAKRAKMEAVFSEQSKLNLNLVWRGEGYNDNAALTIFRHFDSASVEKGWLGPEPKTTWLLDYSLFERIHYLLVAGFDVYGNVGHQLLTRLYMDFLRMEGEQNFLALLPKSERAGIRAHWYRNAPKSLVEHLLAQNQFDQETGIVYNSNDTQHELYTMLKQHLKLVNKQTAVLAESDPMRSLAQLPNVSVQQLPQVSFVLVNEEQGAKGYTLLRHNAHLNITSLLNEGDYRAPNEDYVSVHRGFIGDYPGALYVVEQAQLSAFLTQAAKIIDEKSYADFKLKFAIRRTHQDFWRFSDLLHRVAKEERKQSFGQFDYNRFENR